MVTNDAERYAEAMKGHPYGHALFVPESSQALMPSACGYLDRLGRWAPIVYIDDEDALTSAGLSVPDTLSPRTPRPHTWGPKKSNLVKFQKFGLGLGASAIPAGFPASVKVVLDFESSSAFSAILHCPKQVTHEGYYHRHPFKKWAEANAERLLELVPDVKEHGFWMVTDIYSTADVRVITWSGKGNHVQMGFKVDVTPAGEIGPSGEFFEGASAGEWHRTQAEGDEKLVVFFTGVKMKYRLLPLGRASVREVRGDEEPVVVRDADDKLFQVELEYVGEEPKETE